MSREKREQVFFMNPRAFSFVNFFYIKNREKEKIIILFKRKAEKNEYHLVQKRS